MPYLKDLNFKDKESGFYEMSPQRGNKYLIFVDESGDIHFPCVASPFVGYGCDKMKMMANDEGGGMFCFDKKITDFVIDLDTQRRENEMNGSKLDNFIKELADQYKIKCCTFKAFKGGRNK